MSTMMYYGQDWGGFITVSAGITTKGRHFIDCRREDTGRMYGISIARWISERRAGRIVPVCDDCGRPCPGGLDEIAGVRICDECEARAAQAARDHGQ